MLYVLFWLLIINTNYINSNYTNYTNADWLLEKLVIESQNF